MSTAQDLHFTLLRPPILQILRATGFHSARPSVVDTLTDIAARYLTLLSTQTLEHARNAHEDMPTPRMADVLLALGDVGALRPQMSRVEEDWRGEEDLRGVEEFVGWAKGDVNREIRRVAGLVREEGDVDEEGAEREDFLAGLKKKHSKTGEESRFQGTVLGKDPEPHRIVIEGGAESIQAWGHEIRERERSQSQAAPTTNGTETGEQVQDTAQTPPAFSSASSLSPAREDVMET